MNVQLRRESQVMKAVYSMVQFPPITGIQRVNDKIVVVFRNDSILS